MRRTLLATTALTAVSAIVTGSATAAPVADWKLMTTGATTATTSGLNTDSPVIGDDTSQDADNVWLAGSFGTSYTLAVGQDISVSGSVIFSASGAGEFQNVRYGIWNDNGSFATGNGTTGWDGFLVTSGSSLQEKTGGNFVSNNGSGFGTETADTGTFSNNSTAAYDFVISITRDSATTIDLAASFTGGDGNVVNTYEGLNRTTDKFTFTSFGILLGGNLNLDQADFSNVQVTGSVVPEPSSLALLGLGGLLMLRRSSAQVAKRRRRD